MVLFGGFVCFYLVQTVRQPLGTQLLHRSFDLAETLGQVAMLKPFAHNWQNRSPSIPGFSMLSSLPALAPAAWRQ